MFGTKFSQVKSEDSVKGKRFVVLFDYDPERLSTTGHPEKELKLSEGDVITVKSELDLNGYYMAEMDGTTGLVSSLYIEEIDEYEMRKLRKVCTLVWNIRTCGLVRIGNPAPHES